MLTLYISLEIAIHRRAPVLFQDLHGQVGVAIGVPPKVFELVRLVVHLDDCLECVFFT